MTFPQNLVWNIGSNGSKLEQIGGLTKLSAASRKTAAEPARWVEREPPVKILTKCAVFKYLLPEYDPWKCLPNAPTCHGRDWGGKLAIYPEVTLRSMVKCSVITSFSTCKDFKCSAHLWFPYRMIRKVASWHGPVSREIRLCLGGNDWVGSRYYTFRELHIDTVCCRGKQPWQKQVDKPFHVVWKQDQNLLNSKSYALLS